MTAVCWQQAGLELGWCQQWPGPMCLSLLHLVTDQWAGQQERPHHLVEAGLLRDRATKLRYETLPHTWIYRSSASAAGAPLHLAGSPPDRQENGSPTWEHGPRPSPNPAQALLGTSLVHLPQPMVASRHLPFRDSPVMASVVLRWVVWSSLGKRERGIRRLI